MRRKPHVRFGERDRRNRLGKPEYGALVSTPRCADPSPEDVQVTKSIREAGELLGVELLDHILVGRQQFVSLRERGLGF